MKKILYLLTLALSCQLLNAQNQSAPAVDVPALIWTNGGQSGTCWAGSNSICNTGICLGESVCFAYSLQGVTDHNDYASNHVTLAFSDGGSIVIENTYYTGPNATGCVNYTPSSVGAVTTTSNTGATGYPFTINVLPAAPPVLAYSITPSNPVCVGSQVCAQSFNSPVLNYSFSAPTSSLCGSPVPCPGGGTAFCFPAGNHQIVYTVNAGHTCSNTAVYNVNVSAAQLQLSVTPPATCGDTYCFTASATAGCVVANAVYYWTVTSQSGSYTYTTSTTTPNLCLNMASDTYNVQVYINDATLIANTTVVVPPVNPCVCFSCNSLGTSGTLYSSPQFGQKYCINNNITINGNVALLDCEVKIRSGVGITVAPGAILTINHTKLFSDNAMWAGITVQDGGRVVVENNALIEDALIGVQVYNHTTTALPQILSVDNSIFNKNRMDIRIYGYTPNIATYPFSITNSLFTCRLIAGCEGFLNWPATSIVKAATNPTTTPLQTPYINNSLYPVSSLKAPYAGSKSFFGIRIENSGYSDVSGSTAVYRDVVVGTASGSNTYNVFDHHYIGIDVINSNASVTNCVFQNGWEPSFPTLYSCGVKAVTSTQLNNRLIVNSASLTNNNKFFDLSRGIRAENYFELDASYCDVMSTRVYSPSAATQRGAYGISIQTNHYNQINASLNRIVNIDNGIDFKASVGTFSVGSISTTNNGQYIGTLLCNGNLIRTNIGTPNTALHYGFKGITATGLVGGFRYTKPGAKVETNDNIIKFYVNGISCTNWVNLGVATKNNNIVITQYTPNTYEYGIEHANNTIAASSYFKQYGICDNVVSSLSPYNKTAKTYGIRSAQNSNQAVLCNTVTTMFNGMAFSGYHPNDAYVRFNVTDQDHYGMVLENSGRIGTQGNPAASGDFFDQRWLGAYNAPDFKTAVNNSNAQFSKIHVRNGSNSNPNGSGFLSGSGFPGVNEYSQAAGTIISYSGFGDVANCILTKPGYDQANFRRLEDLLNNPADSSTNQRATYVAKTQLYNYRRMMNVPLDSSTLLASFHSANTGQYRDVFYSAEADIAEGNTTTAQTAVNGFSPTNEIQYKHKQFMGLLFKYQSGTLDASDKTSLLTLAQACPSLDGAMVHQARALFNLAYDETRVFSDSCNYNASSLRKGSFTDMEAEQTADGLLIFPNPSQGDVFVTTSDQTVGQMEIQISSISGAFVSKEIITFTHGRAKIGTSLANGVYMVSLINTQTNERVVKKLVIQK